MGPDLSTSVLPGNIPSHPGGSDHGGAYTVAYCLAFLALVETASLALLPLAVLSAVAAVCAAQQTRPRLVRTAVFLPLALGLLLLCAATVLYFTATLPAPWPQGTTALGAMLTLPAALASAFLRQATTPPPDRLPD